jgi:hypothetical protein
MKKLISIAATLVYASILLGLVQAQEAAKPVKPAASPSQAVLV